ncbi:MAG: Mur ligase family protein, partial [Gammaproteobacteria bacterium]|nr:Mur ligase family protein [Gammaproteobacteria bacterium]
MRRTLSDWLTYQESLNPAEIELGLGRVADVLARLDVQAPPQRVFTVAGTNGKGSCVAALAAVLEANALRTGVYTSPHLLRYNERIVVAGEPVADGELVAAFERVEAARGGVPLTYFEYGTLAALVVFAAADCDAWVLEVGLGGRLDAVNVIDPDFPVITTVDLDHQAWLGDTIEAIAREKAGIYRAGRPAFYGELPVPESVRARVAELGTQLITPEQGYRYSVDERSGQWAWQGAAVCLRRLSLPAGGLPQVRNQAVALAALEACEPEWLQPNSLIAAALTNCAPPGRMQALRAEHDWLLDVAHNVQAGRALAAALERLAPASVTMVLGMLRDKQAEEFVAQFTGRVQRWITCDTPGPRGAAATDLAELLIPVLAVPVVAGG